MDDRLRVLVIDDDPIHREMTRRILGDAYRLHEAETGEEALDLIDRLRFDAVLLDNRLPDYSGIELLPLLAEHGTHVVMMTSLVTEELIAAAQTGGCQQILQKDTLTRETIAAAIGRR